MFAKILLKENLKFVIFQLLGKKNKVHLEVGLGNLKKT